MIKLFRAVFFLAILVLFSCQPNGPGSRPLALNGAMDLSRWDFDKKGPLNLDGKWEFYWGRLLEPADFATSAVSNMPVMTGYAPVPSSWNDGTIEGRKYPAEGCATYRLAVKMPGHCDGLALKLLSFATSYRLFANGALVCSNGSPGTNSRTTVPWARPQVAILPALGGNGGLELVVQVASFGYSRGGFWNTLALGTVRQVLGLRDAGVMTDVFLFGSILVIGLYHIILFLLRRKDRSPLFFGLFCLVISLRTALTGEKLLAGAIPGADWVLYARLEFLTLPMLCSCLMLFIHELYRKEIHRLLFWFSLVTCLLYALVIVFFPVRLARDAMPVFHLLILLCSVFLICILVLILARKRREVLFLLLGFLAVILSTVNDVLYSNGFIYTGYLLPLGVFIFILFQAVLLSIRFSGAFSKVEKLSAQLEQYSQSLEMKVVERTRELANEKNELKIRGDIIENDLQMARKIQMQLIPSASPTDRIAFFYQPMDKVGGDYFDLIQFPDPDTIGIFLSDVSGHGVSAAFITSMIKTCLTQTLPYIDNPAFLLQYLNDMLLNQTGGQFVTAFFGIYSVSGSTLMYSNAGHNPPFIVGEGVETLDTKGLGTVMGIFGNSELKEMGKEFTNRTRKLATGNRVVFYTDGLTEAENLEGEKMADYEGDFESRSLKGILLGNRDKKPADFIRALMDELVRFRGADKFEDDICVISLDA